MAGRQGRFERVALPHMDAAYRLARRLCRQDAEAEDLVQETFLKAYRAFDQFELRNYGARPWLLKILYNTFCTRIGRQAKQPVLIEDCAFDDLVNELDHPSMDEMGAADVNWDLFDDELKEAVEALSPDLRDVLLLWALDDLTYKEIAEVCGCALGTVMSRLYRARQQVGRRLAAYAEQRGLRGDRFES